MSGINYESYRFTLKEFCTFLFSGLCLLGSISYLFYHSVIAFLAGLPFLSFYFRQKKKMCIQRRKEKLTAQFADAIQAFSAGLLVGYSIENALAESYKDLKLIYKEEDDIMVELSGILRKLQNNAVLEDLLLDFAERAGIDDISDFAQVFSVAKRSGGNLNGIIQKAVSAINQKIQVKREIKTVLAAKQYEQKVMNIIPIAIIAYISFTSPHYFDVLYGNVAGVCIMSICLFVYGLSYVLAKRITDIEVS